MTLRLRLVLAASVATLCAVALLGGAAALLSAHELRGSIDRALHQRASDVARLAASAPAILTTPGALDAAAGGRTLSVEVLDRQERIFARSLSLGGRLLPAGGALAAALHAGRSTLLDARLSGEPIRLLVAPLADAGGPTAGGAVLVSSSRADVDATLHRLRILVALSAIGAALLGALLAAGLTHRGLRPLRRLSLAAERIARSGDAAERLPAPGEGGELAQLAQALNRMLAALEHARETERRFLADASHELRTPLTSLRGNAAYVARHGVDQAALQDIEADAERLARLLDDLLALEREEGAAAPSEPTRLRDVAEAVSAERVEVLVRDELVVRAQKNALERALENLVQNAQLHGPASGIVLVEVARDGDEALLSVRDEGPGPAQPELVFGRFWRASDAAGKPGSGLGLSIVAATAARHGGRVSVSGSRFTVHLPILRVLSEPGRTLAEQPEPGDPV